MKIKKLTTVISISAIVLSTLAPSVSAETVTVSGNGISADSSVQLANKNTSLVKQNNNAVVVNKINSTVSTGDNKASHTNGSVTIDTGNATSVTTVMNTLNGNSTQVAHCDTCGTGAPTISVLKNSDQSQNVVNLTNTNNTIVDQTNKSMVVNAVETTSDTGDNEVYGNDEGVTVLTGDASTTATVSTRANGNVASIMRNGSNVGSTVTIAENGIASDNHVGFNLGSAVVLAQENDAKVINEIEAVSYTGDNIVTYSDGAVTIDTGNATADVDVKNMVNFNAAVIDEGVILDGLTITVSNNGYDTENGIMYNVAQKKNAEQTNNTSLFNEVEEKADTGANEAHGTDGTTTFIATGDINSSTDVTASGGINLFGQEIELVVPEIDFHFSLRDLFGFLT